MHPGEQDTRRIDRDELRRLLDTMTPLEQQAVTKRSLIAEVEAELARRSAEPALIHAPSDRIYVRPFSHVAALLTARPTRPGALVRARTQPPIATHLPDVIDIHATTAALR